MSGIWGPLCSSPITTGEITPAGRIARICCPLSGGEKSNCLTSATKNVCISRILLAAGSQLISSSFLFGMTVKKTVETHANLHPMQLLAPPEKLRLYRRVTTYGTSMKVIEASYSQAVVDSNGRLRLVPHVEPSLRSKFISVWSPKFLASAKRCTSFRSPGRCRNLDGENGRTSCIQP